MDFYVRLGQRLRALRIRAGLSQSALGARLGRSASAIDRYEMGQRRIAIADLDRLAKILGVSLESFLERPAARDSSAARGRSPSAALRRPETDRLWAEHRRLLRELDRRLHAPREGQPAAVREAPQAYGPRHDRSKGDVPPEDYAAGLPPARLRAWARRAGWPEEVATEVLRRYAGLVLEHFVRQRQRERC